MTESELRKKVVEQATSWYGRNEADGTHKEIIDVYNSIRPLPRGYKMRYTDPWCAAFVSAVAQKLGLTSIIYPECGCDQMIAKYRAAGRFAALDGAGGVMIQPGDLAFYDWNQDGASDHVGIITEVTAAGYRVIEGNKTDAVGTRTVLRNYNLIKGFAIPAYQGASASETAQTGAQEVSVVKDFDYQLGFHKLAYGAGMGGQAKLREEVRAVQLILRALGFDIGSCGLDGQFGNDTLKAVKQYQQSVRITVTGVIDPATRAALNGL